MKNILHIDQQLCSIIKDINILEALAPSNYQQQKSEFFSSNFSKQPQFTYAEHNVDLFRKKRDLFNLPIDQLDDDDLITLYSGVIQSFADKLDQYQSIGTPQFLYDSLRYYGEPCSKDINNANFILHLPDEPEEKQQALMDAQQILAELKSFAEKHRLQYQIKLDDNMIANILVSGTLIKINSAARINRTEVYALAHHEVGVHLLTTLNARLQPLKILSLGCPVNTTTQEGLAILCEYLAGFMTLSRLKVLALRVIAVESMIDEKDFKQTFLLLKEEYQVADDLAFTITTRVYRGGGFTKDFLYLKGFRQMLNAYETQDNFNHLLCGKVSLDCIDLISRLIDKNYLIAAKHISPSILQPAKIDAVKQFVAHAIR